MSKKPHFTAKYSFKTWLYTIGRNTALNYIKHARKISDMPVEDLVRLCGDEETLEKSYIQEEEKIILHRAIGKLKAEYGQVLYLKFFEDLSNEQIAKVMKMKSKTCLRVFLF